MMSERDSRTMDLANRLHDMTYAEWERVQHVINKKFEAKKKESELQLQLSLLAEDDFKSYHPL